MEMGGFCHPKVTWSEFLFMSWCFFFRMIFSHRRKRWTSALLQSSEQAGWQSQKICHLFFYSFSFSYLQNPKKEALAVVQCVPPQHLRLLSSSLTIWKLARQKKEHGSMGMCFQQENIELAHRAGEKINLHRSQLVLQSTKKKNQKTGLWTDTTLQETVW